MGNLAESIKNDAAAFGTAVHEAIEQTYTKERPSDLPWKVDLALKNFQGWADANVEEFLAFEKIALNEEHLYGGTLDCIAKMKDGRIALLDFKTSKNIYREYDLQTAGYVNATTFVDCDIQPIDIEVVYIVHLDSKKFTWSHHIVTNLEENFKVFLSALRLYKWSNAA